MSRYDLEQRNPAQFGGNLEITIGWDHPMKTYFVQIFNPAHEETEAGYEILWRGTSFSEILSPDDAIALVKPWAKIPKDLRDSLIADRAEANIKQKEWADLHWPADNRGKTGRDYTHFLTRLFWWSVRIGVKIAVVIGVALFFGFFLAPMISGAGAVTFDELIKWMILGAISGIGGIVFSGRKV